MKIKVPATSANLGPGFDCLGLALSLFNEVEIKETRMQSIDIKGFNKDDKELFKNNLFIEIFKKEFTFLNKSKKCEFSFKFDNKIPFSRGLGSSSAVIVSALASAFFMAGKKVSKKEILNAALKYENHPDNIAPATLGGFVCALIENKNELASLKAAKKKNFKTNSQKNLKENLEVFSIKKKIDKDLKALICIPENAFNTEKSRASLAKNIAFEKAVFNLAHASFLTACFLSKKYEFLRLASKDKLHQISRMKALNELFSVQKLALENGALMSTLSGSGSSFFNLLYKDDTPRLERLMRARFSKFDFKILDFDDKGFEIC